ncbi:MAG: phosphatidylserine decarboxylase [Deltaproteobacteria bacterium]
MMHQYIERESGRIRTEVFFGESLVKFLYGPVRENAPALFDILTSARISSFLGFLNYDVFLGQRINRRFFQDLGIDLSECLDPPHTLDTPRKVFERKIRYWELRPLAHGQDSILSPADAKAFVGSLRKSSSLFVKGKFFDLAELLGEERGGWVPAFQDGDFAVFRLTPEKYHYNHVPVSGKVLDIYEIPGRYHSCHPEAVLSIPTPYSKNKRVVTILDTDLPGGTGVGLVAMVEIVALMIGGIEQCYSEERYDYPQPITRGLFLRAGCPKSLFRPGSSTVILLFQKDRVIFEEDILRNQNTVNVESRYSLGLGRPVVETEVRVRSAVARARKVRS